MPVGSLRACRRRGLPVHHPARSPPSNGAR